MTRRSCQHMLALGIVAVLALTPGCSDNTTAPATGAVSGTVSFSGTWPASGDIQVSIYSNLNPPYIPMGPPDGFTDPIPGPVVSFDYTLNGLAMGDYTAVYVSWRDPQNPANSRLLGMYWMTTGDSGIDPSNGAPKAPPTPVTIDASHLVQSSLDITADLDLAP